ncbi:voltage-dependent calcium channel subunit alpha-2/delta-3 [Eupeodes corollae]|uniref:voltage-dependent calcium channel subunit alpha-2/delta-3 n=1 Tax=Eupeodes corollae TaxID=290404 RepID=UPI0024919A58|nr:voltage-dependent calcium channel subunit alpha-2/delta-3 [Eupeodes corollae]
MFLLCEKLMSRICLFVAIIFLLHLIWIPPQPVTATLEDDAIGKWADKFGEELWDLAKKMTKSPEIKSKYKEYNARVEHKNGTALIKSIVKNVGRMLSRKMDAVKCILQKAEEEAENFVFNKTYAMNEFQYYSSKYSKVNGHRALELMETIEKNSPMYLNMTLNEDTHFYNIFVNTSHSSVHVPSNIYDKYPEVLKAIMWSENLDAVFLNNYKTDPALSWQYFGSDTGILRHYPALQWEPDKKTDDADIYDCRKRSWYIETATCSKDIVILLDNSGSMTGFRNHIAKFTIRSVLDTFSNNDFFTIFNYSKTCDDIIPCFKDALVQATPENIDVFNKAIAKMAPEGYANLTLAYEKAFQLLKKYYIERRCNETLTCNQAIMLVTDGVAGNTTEIFEKYNWGTGENGTDNMKIRIFTYLLGKEVTKVREIQWMACLNRGYYSHIQTLDEVHEEVLKYVDVIATPLVLQNVQHPPTWTHSFADKTVSDDEQQKSGKQRLMIAVGVPAFDRSWRDANSTRRARLLGVAGTDVPVEDIDKLTLPYKLGVNGYSFVISNNGYVIFHPDLRPSQDGVINPNYNSIDLTEVEHLYEDNQPRRPGEKILELRGSMVRGEAGKKTDITVKFHYDKMRRVSEEDQDYFYEPLVNTPFSLGLVVPSTYGKSWIKVGEEVKKNIHMGINISDFFVGDNWKIHPDWVYCKYHYLEGHEFKSPEEEFRHFLSKMVQKDWMWSEQYEKDASDETIDNKPNCGRITLNDDAYYCNKELVQLVIFEAKVTNSSYGEWKFKDDEEKTLIERYNASLRFVATMSGLTRWQFIYGEVEVETDFEFGDYHTRAVDETWYKSAILQHRIDPDSFVYSVPHANDPLEGPELKVTASHAIFPRDGGMEAPACVVGFQFPHVKMWERFANITSEENCNGCVKTCNADDHECYVLDNNAYVLISQNNNDTGRFFGDVESGVMNVMVEMEIFKAIDVYDYQALCMEVVETSSDAHSLLHPIRLLSLGLKWLVTEIFWHWSRLQMWAEGMPFYDDDDSDDYDNGYIGPRKTAKLPEGDEDKKEFKKPPPPPKYDHCDKKSTLFTLQEKNIDFNNYIRVNNSRPFHLKRIPKSNLILIVVKVMFATEHIPMTTKPTRIEYDVEFPCYKLNMSFLERQRIAECFTEHPDEPEFTYCGDAASIRLNLFNLFSSFIILIIMRYLRHLVD